MNFQLSHINRAEYIAQPLQLFRRVRRERRRVRQPSAVLRLQWGLWCGVLVILIAANFGVVLEGPMGAVPFWIMLALAHTGDDAALRSHQEEPNATVTGAERTELAPGGVGR